MNEIAQKIIEYLNSNRVTTTEVADVLGKSGAINDISPVNKGHYCAGVIKYIYALNESNYTVHEQIKNIEPDKVVLIDSVECKNRAIMGELVSKYLLLYRRSKAIVVTGNIRDAAEIYRENYPIWCTGFNPVGCFNKPPESKEINDKIEKNKSYYEGSIAVCDDCGVVVIPNNRLNEEMLDSLKSIEAQEDIWFDRLNHYKESTFEIVCQKKYLSDSAYMLTRRT